MDQTVDAAITTSAGFMKLLLFALEGQKKVLNTEPDSKALEDQAGPISQTFFLWLNSLFLTGYKRAFITTDLGMISSPFYTKRIFPRFSRIGSKGSHR